LNCIPGRYQNFTKQIDCIDCPVGRASTKVGRETQCESCTPGRSQEDSSMTKCLICSPGSYAQDSGADICSLCPGGWLQVNGGGTNCTAPEQGQISAGGASAVAIAEGWMADDCTSGVCKTSAACPPGTKSRDDRMGCDPCKAGETSTKGATSCSACSKGRFAALKGSECKECPIGWYQPQDFNPSLKCMECPSGWGAIEDENNVEISGSAVCRDLVSLFLLVLFVMVGLICS